MQPLQITIEPPDQTEPMHAPLDPPQAPATLSSDDLVIRLAEESADADNGWRKLQEMTEHAYSTAAQLAGTQAQVQVLASQLELARESAAEWQATARGAERISEERRVRLDRLNEAVEGLTSSLAEQTTTMTDELDQIQARWQKTEDQRFAAVEQCVALETMVTQADRKLGAALRAAAAAEHQVGSLKDEIAQRDLRIGCLLEKGLMAARFLAGVGYAEPRELWRRVDDAENALLGAFVSSNEDVPCPANWASIRFRHYQAAFSRGMRIAGNRIERLEASLTALETQYTELENRAWRYQTAGFNALEVCAVEQLHLVLLSEQLGLVEEHLLGGFRDELHQKLGVIPPELWLSTRAFELESTLVSYQQAEHEALASGTHEQGEQIELSQAESCQRCGHERKEWEGFIRGNDDVWRCGPCDAHNRSQDLATRLSTPPRTKRGLTMPGADTPEVAPLESIEEMPGECGVCEREVTNCPGAALVKHEGTDGLWLCEDCLKCDWVRPMPEEPSPDSAPLGWFDPMGSNQKPEPSPDCLRRLTMEELAAVEPLTEATVSRALELGRQEADAPEVAAVLVPSCVTCANNVSVDCEPCASCSTDRQGPFPNWVPNEEPSPVAANEAISKELGTASIWDGCEVEVDINEVAACMAAECDEPELLNTNRTSSQLVDSSELAYAEPDLVCGRCHNDTRPASRLTGLCATCEEDTRHDGDRASWQDAFEQHAKLYEPKPTDPEVVSSWARDAAGNISTRHDSTVLVDTVAPTDQEVALAWFEPGEQRRSVQDLMDSWEAKPPADRSEGGPDQVERARQNSLRILTAPLAELRAAKPAKWMGEDWDSLTPEQQYDRTSAQYRRILGLSESSDSEPNTCTPEHPRALDKTGRVLSRYPRRKTLKSSSRMHLDSGGAEGRTCDGKSEIGLSKPVTRDAFRNVLPKYGQPPRKRSTWTCVQSLVGQGPGQGLEGGRTRPNPRPSPSTLGQASEWQGSVMSGTLSCGAIRGSRCRAIEGVGVDNFGRAGARQWPTVSASRTSRG